MPTFIRTIIRLLACIVALSCPLALTSAQDDPGDTQADRFWPQWRGPLGTGVAPHADPPVQWSENENVRWKLELPGSGHSTPVVWGDRVFITMAVPYGEAVEPTPSRAPGVHDYLAPTRRHEFVVLAAGRRDHLGRGCLAGRQRRRQRIAAG